MTEDEIKELLKRFREGKVTDAEKAFLESWYLDFSDPSTEDITDEERLKALDQVWLNLSKNDQPAIRRQLWPKLAVAASILICLSAGVYWSFYKARQQPQIVKNTSVDFAPGSTKAVLTLANGSQIILNSQKNGDLARQGAAIVRKKTNGQLVYKNLLSAKSNTNGELIFNTINTPRGGTYQLTLADGTSVWLNAASSITYPTTFFGKDREVKITGQAYFEVAHNPEKPFIVNVRGQTVRVLGTHFDINAYEDEPSIKTTLLQGRVRVSSKEGGINLNPGQQSSFKQNTNTITVEKCDTTEATAWKDGLFKFHRTDIKVVMRQISRWYNVDVEYEGASPQELLTGEMYRNINAKEALTILKYANVNFKIQNNKIIILPSLNNKLNNN